MPAFPFLCGCLCPARCSPSAPQQDRVASAWWQKVAASPMNCHRCCFLGVGLWWPVDGRGAGPRYKQCMQLLSLPAFLAPLRTGCFGAGRLSPGDVTASDARCLDAKRWCRNSLYLQPDAARPLLNRLVAMWFHRHHGIWHEENFKYLLTSHLPFPEKSQQKRFKTIVFSFQYSELDIAAKMHDWR